MTTPPSVFWFRRDLRLSDHPALLEAVARGRGRVAALFILDDDFLLPAGATRVNYLRATLEALSAQLNGALVLRRGDPAVVLEEVVKETGATDVVATRDFGPKGRARDERVERALANVGVRLTLLDAPYVVAPGVVRTKTGSPSRVFSAFRRGWQEQPLNEPYDAPRDATFERLASLEFTAFDDRPAPIAPAYFGELAALPPAPIGPAGEIAGLERLRAFTSRVGDYDQTRNLPGVEGTSRLSPYLRFGALHPRTVLRETSGLASGHATFASEICWREFYADVLFHQPDSTWRVLQPSLASLKIDRDARAVERFQSWAMGRTGYPLVDAGMRQLLHEGWMHNRVRMVAASFLVKHLHLDWRWGAKWFMWRLIDGDLASNQHGWQWTAGTGTDAAPFHRVFNPTLQAERFDPEGAYVRRYVRELTDVAAPQCLQPGGGTGLLRPADYAAPLVDADEERKEALARFAQARADAAVAS
ncbi:MAG: deoxyribodipyrimidine photo-lyase [Acidobacteriota bacterium]|nr:deoxyribodipyrimidine photo-lyase [Acidobacteriota bacterium]